MLLRLSSFSPSISSHLRRTSPWHLQGSQLLSLVRTKVPAFPIRPFSPFCLPIASQRSSFFPRSSLLQSLELMHQKALHHHAQGGDSSVDGASEEKDSILDGTCGNGSGSSSGAGEVLGKKDVNLEADRVGVSQGGAPVISFDGDASSNSGDLSGGRAARIREKLERGLSPVELEVEDVSYQHAGHAAVRGNGDGETHFNVKIVSKEFEGKSLVKRHRLVYDLLQDEMQSGLHALSIVAKTPS